MSLPKDKPSSQDALTAFAQLIHHVHDGEVVLKVSGLGDGFTLHGDWVLLTNEDGEETGELGIRFVTKEIGTSNERKLDSLPNDSIGN